jgi:uncharacterized protein YndB with AHSA1/START domain
MSSPTDRIERHITLKAPISRVWRALSNAEEFGKWFGVALSGKAMKVGETLEGPATYPGYEHIVVRMQIERMEPERSLAWRWHPAANDPTKDYSAEPMTLVVFELEEVPGGTRLSVVESGLDSIPLERRAHVFRLNTAGWDEQMVNIDKYVAAN